MVTRTTLTRRGSCTACGLSLHPAQAATSNSAYDKATGEGMRTSCFIFPPAEGRMRWAYRGWPPEERPSQIYGDRLAGLEQCGPLRLRTRFHPVMQFRKFTDRRFRRGERGYIGNRRPHRPVALVADQRHRTAVLQVRGHDERHLETHFDLVDREDGQHWRAGGDPVTLGVEWFGNHAADRRIGRFEQELPLRPRDPDFPGFDLVRGSGRP